MRIILAILLALIPAAAMSQSMPVRIYFDNQKMNPNSDPCSKVYPVTRRVPKSLATARVALEQLFAGPTPEEAARGYVSIFSAETANLLKRVKLIKKTAYVDLRDLTTFLGNASTSCGSAAFFAQIETTLRRFATIKKVVFAVEGNPADFYERMQVGCEGHRDCDPTLFKNW